MKLSELRPCIACDGALVGPMAGGPIFYIVDVSQAMLDETATRQVLGLNTMFKDRLGIAEMMAPNADGAVKVFSEEAPELRSRLFFCQNCYIGNQIKPGAEQFLQPESLAIYCEKAERRREAEKQKAAARNAEPTPESNP